MASVVSDKKIIGYSDLRNNLSEMMSRVIYNYDELIAGNVKKNSNQTVSIISTEILDEILSAYEFSTKISFDEITKQYEIMINEINADGFAETREEAIEITIDNVKALTEDFFEGLDKYIRFEHYRRQYPYYLRIKHCKSQEELKEILKFK